MDEFCELIGERIKEERFRLDMPQLAFAEACNVSRGALLKWEKGEATPNAGVLALMAGLGVDVLYVVTGQRANASESTLAPAERELLQAWRNGSPDGRSALEAMARVIFLPKET
ncbi:helix-turn-helix domain-containing protein [Comamonas thiooxydans]|uniref:Helix-turn-helix domain-containing protein n=1 Tax=Comamonas thiooxydans TaxID=363952 RepID=A0AA42TSR2_9BURK|nr:MULTISPECIES: helix-turn-helix transcriptional regulator [Comamonas]MDH1333510.1 helix-turn-helix domain-containing protein [Comamonas thiooxydans]MDH1738717.1 helix-turn-helix domain-containing protein [Comamonas thiooxydans]MDH1788249.1 helix-turn-helix domain-containing protein [Comamonas thiooxydans]